MRDGIWLKKRIKSNKMAFKTIVSYLLCTEDIGDIYKLIMNGVDRKRNGIEIIELTACGNLFYFPD